MFTVSPSCRYTEPFLLYCGFDKGWRFVGILSNSCQVIADLLYTDVMWFIWLCCCEMRHIVAAFGVSYQSIFIDVCARIEWSKTLSTKKWIMFFVVFFFILSYCEYAKTKEMFSGPLYWISSLTKTWVSLYISSVGNKCLKVLQLKFTRPISPSLQSNSNRTNRVFVSSDFNRRKAPFIQ